MKKLYFSLLLCAGMISAFTSNIHSLVDAKPPVVPAQKKAEPVDPIDRAIRNQDFFGLKDVLASQKAKITKEHAALAKAFVDHTKYQVGQNNWSDALKTMVGGCAMISLVPVTSVFYNSYCNRNNLTRGQAQLLIFTLTASIPLLYASATALSPLFMPEEATTNAKNYRNACAIHSLIVQKLD